MFGESAKLEFIADAYASEEMANELREKLGIKTDSLGDNYVISFAYTDYGGDFLDKVAIAYFSENYPENTIKENSGWGGENAFVFGEPAKEWIEQTQDYALGFEDFEDFYYEKQNEQEGDDFNYFLDEIVRDYTFDREVVIDWLMENKSGYYGMTTQGLDFSWTDLTAELVNEGLIEKSDEDEYAGGGKLGAESKSKIKIIENKKEGKKTATQTLVKENNKGEKITYELSAGMHTTPKENRYADGWFEIYATDENDDEYFYSEGGLWIENGRIYDYDGVYELSEKLKPLLSALNLNSEDVFSEGGEAGELKNVGGNAFYITDTSVENADKNFDSLSDTFFSSKDDFENNMDAIQEFSFNVNVKYQYNIIPAIYEQMAEEGVGNDEGNIQILGF
jgi:hypothetical protein